MHYRESQAARGVAYYEDEGRGVRRNPRSSMALVQEGRCARRHPAQLSLARYALGEGAPQDLRQAKEWLGRACDGGSQLGCEEYARFSQMGY